jgi:hydrogenase expression/formation protein HypE
MSERSATTGGLDFEGWVCPTPLRDTPTIVMGHGGGGAMSGELIEQLFLPAFGGAAHAELGDSAVLSMPPGRLAFSTDSFVVKPMFFPGGSIGDLAVNGTVNDLAMSGATPLYLSTAFILSEGTALAEIGRVAMATGKAAEVAGVQLVTGDTKVVDSASGDGVYINTTGIGVVPDGIEIGPRRAEVGDAVLISGAIGVHGIAVMSCREGLEFGTTIESDSAALHGLVAEMLATGVDVHVLRDPTRGGVAASLNEIAKASGVGIELVESNLPIPPEVRDACGLLGLDPLQVANEGKLVAIVPGTGADEVLAAMRAHPLGADARRIGTCVGEHPRMVVARTGLGGTRVVDLPIGEQLPRIC